jgi:hypothetical protein
MAAVHVMLCMILTSSVILIIFRRLQQAGHVAFIGEKIEQLIILMVKPLRKRTEMVC